MNAKAEEMEEKAAKVDWTDLLSRFPAKDYEWVCIANEVGQDKQAMWAVYISADAIRDRLNLVLGPAGWSYTIIDKQVNSEELGFGGKKQVKSIAVVHARLEIDGAVREDIGVDLYDSENAFKSAASNAMTRCAKAFGIGNEVNEARKAFTKDFKTRPTQSAYDFLTKPDAASGPTHAVSGAKASAKAPAASEDMLAELETTKALLRDKAGKNAAMVYKAIVQKVRPADPKNPTDQEIEEIVQALHDGPLKSDADSGADPF